MLRLTLLALFFSLQYFKTYPGDEVTINLPLEIKNGVYLARIISQGNESMIKLFLQR